MSDFKHPSGARGAKRGRAHVVRRSDIDDKKDLSDSVRPTDPIGANPKAPPSRYSPNRELGSQPTRSQAPHIVRRGEPTGDAIKAPVVAPRPEGKARPGPAKAPRPSTDLAETTERPPLARQVYESSIDRDAEGLATVSLARKQAELAQRAAGMAVALEEPTTRDQQPNKADTIDELDPAYCPVDDPDRGFLMVSDGPDRGRRVGLPEGRTSIGRGLENDVVLTDRSVSRHHCYIERRDNIYFICDLRSGNGTRVNGRERHGEVLIVDGDSFTIGKTTIALEGPEARHKLNDASWAPAVPDAAGKGRKRAPDEAESTVAGKGLVRKRKPQLSSDPLTNLPTNIVDGPEQKAPSVEVDPELGAMSLDEESTADRGGAVAALSLPTHFQSPSPPARAREPEVDDELATHVRMPPGQFQTEPPTHIYAESPKEEQPVLSLPTHFQSPQPAPLAMEPPTHLPDPLADSGRSVETHIRAPHPTGANTMMATSERSAPEVERAALDALASIALTPAPQLKQEPVYGTQELSAEDLMTPGDGDLPSIIMPPTPSPAIPFPMGGPPEPEPVRPRPTALGIGSMQGRPGNGPMPSPMGVPMHEADAPIPGVRIRPGVAPDRQPSMPNMGRGGAGMHPHPAMPTGPQAMARPTQAPSYATDPYNFQRPNPAQGQNRFLISLISVGLVLVLVGIVAAFMGRNDERKAIATEVPADSKAAENEVPNSSEPNREGILLADLSSGRVQLAASAFGNDESFLQDLPTNAPIVEELQTTETTATEPSPPTIDPRVVGRPTTEPLPTKIVGTKPNKETTRNTTKETPRTARDPDDSKVRGGSGNLSSIKSSADALYRRGEFAEAASKLEKAADREDDETGEELLELANDYRRIQTLLDKAREEEDSDPAAAMSSLTTALRRDKDAGGAHSGLIKKRIGKIAPDAAKLYMARGRLVDAKNAADTASQYGMEDEVEAVYRSLEKKAESLVRKGKKAADDGETKEAAEHFRNAVKIAPKDSEVYEEAKEELADL